MANEQTKQVTVVVSPKSVGIAVLLAALFGPLGMFYSTIPGALIMMVVTIIVFFFTLGLGVLITWPICLIWAGLATSAQNKKLMTGTK